MRPGRAHSNISCHETASPEAVCGHTRGIRGGISTWRPEDKHYGQAILTAIAFEQGAFEWLFTFIQISTPPSRRRRNFHFHPPKMRPLSRSGPIRQASHMPSESARGELLCSGPVRQHARQHGTAGLNNTATAQNWAMERNNN